MEFFGKYIDVTPHSRLVWTNDEVGEGGAVTVDLASRSSNWMSCSSPWARALDGLNPGAFS
jgi:hypothetical protein